MKKFLALALAFCMIVTSVVFMPMTVAAENADSIIYVSADGNDSNAGTVEEPVATIGKAISLVADKGTIMVVGTIAPTTHAAYAGDALGKTVTVTSDGTGLIDFSAIQFVQLKNNMTFENVALKFMSTDTCYLFACGYELVIEESVTFAEGSGSPHAFGGAYQKSCGPTSITLLAGKYKNVHGASHDNNYDVDGDTYVHVGGTASANNVFGSGSKSDVEGNAFVLVDGSAKVSYVYGAGTGAHTVTGNTDITVGGSADVKKIYGGSESASAVIGGSTSVTITDTANQNCQVPEENHPKTYEVYGGGKGTINGSTNVYIQESARASYVFGGMPSGSTGSIGMGSNVYVMGGTVYSVYGSGINVDHGTGVNVTMTGGIVYQLFGGCEGGNASGNILIKLLGGTVKRRVFGGCYNEYDGGWKSSYSVAGTINLVLGSDGAVDFSSQEPGILGSLKNDHALSAHSRRSSKDNNEHAYIIYADSGAQSKFTLKLGQVSGGTTQDAKHLYSYTLDGSSITQYCDICKTTGIATITPNGDTYTGEAIGLSVAYSDNWEFEEFDITYANNVNFGTATATLSIEGITTQTYNYFISKNTVEAPTVYANNNQIAGLTTNMEYSDDGISYKDVTDADMTFADGVYYVRYKGTESNYASPAVKVYFGNSISANKVNTVQGGTVDIIVRIPVNTGVDNINVTLGYDNTALTLESFTAVDFAGAAIEGNVITWSGNSTNNTGTLAKLTFTVNEDAAIGSYAITLEANGFSAANGEIKVAEFVNGDVNGDGGKVTSTDVVALRTAIVAGATQGLGKGADADGNGIVDSNDLIVIRQYLDNYDYDAGESSIVLGNDHE